MRWSGPAHDRRVAGELPTGRAGRSELRAHPPDPWGQRVSRLRTLRQPLSVWLPAGAAARRRLLEYGRRKTVLAEPHVLELRDGVGCARKPRHLTLALEPADE